MDMPSKVPLPPPRKPHCDSERAAGTSVDAWLKRLSSTDSYTFPSKSPTTWNSCFFSSKDNSLCGAVGGWCVAVRFAFVHGGDRVDSKRGRHVQIPTENALQHVGEQRGQHQWPGASGYARVPLASGFESLSCQTHASYQAPVAGHHERRSQAISNHPCSA